jgi:uncharacterized membrane protein
VSEILGEYGVHATWYEGEIQDLRESPHPCILLMKDGALLPMSPIWEGGSGSQSSGTAFLESLEDLWSGCFLQCIPTEYVGEYRWTDSGTAKRRPFRRAVGFLPVSLAVAAIWPLISSCLNYDRPYRIFSILLATTLLGGLVACLLLTMKRHFQLELPFCGANQKSGCAKVMASSASAVAGIPLADLGLILFLGGILMIDGANARPGLFRYAIAPFVLALPASAYLVFYQKFVLKSWCIYCLVIQAFVWLASHFLFCLYRAVPPSPHSFHDMIWIASCFAIATCLVIALEYFIYPYYGQDDARLAFDRFLQAPFLIESQIRSGKKVNSRSLDKICVFGSGDISLTLIASPSCLPCKTALQDAFRLLKISNQAFTLDIQFLVSESDSGLFGDTAEYLATIMMLLDRKEVVRAERAFWDCFIDRSALGGRWFSVYGEAKPHYLDRARKALRGCAVWCQDNDIQTIPTAVLNEHVIRNPIKVRNLVYWAMRRKEA